MQDYPDKREGTKITVDVECAPESPAFGRMRISMNDVSYSLASTPATAFWFGILGKYWKEYQIARGTKDTQEAASLSWNRGVTSSLSATTDQMKQMFLPIIRYLIEIGTMGPRMTGRDKLGLPLTNLFTPPYFLTDPPALEGRESVPPTESMFYYLLNVWGDIMMPVSLKEFVRGTLSQAPGSISQSLWGAKNVGGLEMKDFIFGGIVAFLSSLGTNVRMGQRQGFGGIGVDPSHDLFGPGTNDVVKERGGDTKIIQITSSAFMNIGIFNTSYSGHVKRSEGGNRLFLQDASTDSMIVRRSYQQYEIRNKTQGIGADPDVIQAIQPASNTVYNLLKAIFDLTLASAAVSFEMFPKPSDSTNQVNLDNALLNITWIAENKWGMEHGKLRVGRTGQRYTSAIAAGITAGAHELIRKEKEEIIAGINMMNNEMATPNAQGQIALLASLAPIAAANIVNSQSVNSLIESQKLFLNIITWFGVENCKSSPLFREILEQDKSKIYTVESNKDIDLSDFKTAKQIVEEALNDDKKVFIVPIGTNTPVHVGILPFQHRDAKGMILVGITRTSDGRQILFPMFHAYKQDEEFITGECELTGGSEEAEAKDIIIEKAIGLLSKARGGETEPNGELINEIFKAIELTRLFNALGIKEDILSKERYYLPETNLNTMGRARITTSLVIAQNQVKDTFDGIMDPYPLAAYNTFYSLLTKDLILKTRKTGEERGEHQVVAAKISNLLSVFLNKFEPRNRAFENQLREQFISEASESLKKNDQRWLEALWNNKNWVDFWKKEENAKAGAEILYAVWDTLWEVFQRNKLLVQGDTEPVTPAMSDSYYIAAIASLMDYYHSRSENKPSSETRPGTLLFYPIISSHFAGLKIDEHLGNDTHISAKLNAIYRDAMEQLNRFYKLREDPSIGIAYTTE